METGKENFPTHYNKELRRKINPNSPTLSGLLPLKSAKSESSPSSNFNMKICNCDVASECRHLTVRAATGSLFSSNHLTPEGNIAITIY